MFLSFFKWIESQTTAAILRGVEKAAAELGDNTNPDEAVRLLRLRLEAPALPAPSPAPAEAPPADDPAHGNGRRGKARV